MSENFSILKVLPPKLRAARIGSCYNTYKRELIQGSQAFDLKKLAAANLLESVLGSSKTYFNLSSSSKKSMSNKFRSMAAQAQFGLGACKASLGFNMSSAGTSASTQRDIGGYLSHMVNGTFYQMNSASATPSVLYSCMTDSFKEMYKKVVDAKPENRLQEYKRFTDMFGHGVVTKLDLTSGAYAKFTLTASSTANSETAKYGVSGSYGTPSGAGAAAATEWGKSHKEAIGEMNLAYESEVFPPNSPAGKWVEPLREMAIEWAKDLAKPPKFAEVKDPDAPKLPDIPKVPKPEPVEPPKPNAAQKDEEDEEKLKLELKRQDGCEELSMSEWEEEIETLEEKDLDGHLQDMQRLSLSISAEEEEEVPESFQIENQASELSDNGYSADLGEFLPCGFEIEPWTKLFPDLKLGTVKTINMINWGRLNMFYFSRLQFGQYLAFLADIDIEYYHPNIKLDTEKYNSVCEDFWKKINSAFKSKGPFDSKKLGRLIKKFDDLLTRKKFHNMKVYELFFKHYAFFRNCPYGFMHIEHDNKDYQNKEGNYYFLLDFSTIEGRQRVITKRRAAKIGAFPTIGESLAQGMRWYPVITNEGEFRFLCFAKQRNDKWKWSESIILTGPHTSPHFSNGEIVIGDICLESGKKTFGDLVKKYDKVKNIIKLCGLYVLRETGSRWDNDRIWGDTTLKAISHTDINFGTSNLKIRGDAMFSDYPFDTIIEDFLGNFD